ncbi:co-chaperone YbbN [Citricoccus zhacaiensis]|uniref:co-chaperone YbbN n=1 Tax=Citricoccus sp. K5 TaxID=2653135 RepID=UPI0012F199BA|nr:tetratricopeptide repeat protein [Citricoccus sp. K5]VXB17210.1 Putative thioredoxin [Citricoccus sp. K5]
MSQQPPAMPTHLRGALDLSALKRPAGQPGPQGQTGQAGQPRQPGPAGQPSAQGGPAGSWVLDNASQGDLQQLVQLSSRVPVLVHLAAPSNPASQQIDDLVAPAVDARGGQLILARVDAEADPQVLQVFGLAAGPAVVAVLAGQPIPVLNQAVPADQLEQLLDELLAAAAQNGVSGTVPPLAPAREYGQGAGGSVGNDAPAAPALPPLHQEAQDALEAGQYEAAKDAYRRALAENPADAEAKVGLSRAGLFARTAAMDSNAVRERGATEPDEVQAQIDVADLDVLGGHVEDAFNRLVRFIAGHPGQERNTAREHLVDLYTVVGDQDPRTSASRKALAMALF